MKCKIAIIVFLYCSFHAHAQPDSLQRYLAVAETNNLQLQAQYHSYLSVFEKTHQAGVLPDPQMEAGVFVKPMETLMGKQYANIKLMQMFPWFGTLAATKDEARYMAQMESDAYRNLRREVLFNVQKEYFALYALQQEINNTRMSIGVLKRIEEAAIYHYEAGTSAQALTTEGMSNRSLPSSPTPSTNSMNNMNMGAVISSNTPSATNMPGMPSGGNMNSMPGEGNTMSDILQIRIETAEWENILLSLTDRMETLLVSFNSLLNRPPATPVTLPDSLFPPIFMINEQAIADSIRQNHPMLQIYASETSRNEAALSMTRHMGMPMIGLGIEYMPMGASSMAMPDMNGRDMVMPMISLSLPVYRGKYKAQQREIDLQQQSIQANAANTTNILLVEMKEAVQFYKEAMRRARLYETQRTLLEQNINLLLIQYSSGKGNVISILRAEQQLLDYRIRLAKVIADQYTGKAWIEKLMFD